MGYKASLDIFDHKLSAFAPFLVNIPQINTVSSIDEFKLHGHPDTVFYDTFKEIFGNDGFFVIAFEDEQLFSEKTLTMLSNITAELEALPETRKVKSLANIDDLKGGEDYFEVSRFLENIPEDAEKMEMLKTSAVSNKLYRSHFVSPDGSTAAVVVSTYDRPDDPEYRKKIIRKTTKILDKYKTDGIRFHLAGPTKINNDISLFMEKDLRVFIPVTFLLMTILIWFFFKNVRLTVIAVINITVCVGAALGLFAVTGITLNNVTSIVPPLIMALALCDTVHIFSCLETRVLKTFQNRQDAVYSVLSKVFIPCFLTTLTTVVGFASLMSSELAPIRHFGLIAGCGMVFELVFSFLFLPALLLFCNPDKIFTIDHAEKKIKTVLTGINKIVQHHFKVIVFAGAAISLAGVFFAGKIKVETDFAAYFKPHSQVRQALDFVEEKMSGTGSLDILFSASEMDAFKNPVNLKRIETVQNYLDSLDGVDVTSSLADFIKDMNQSFHNENPAYYQIPDNRQLIWQYLLLYDSSDIEDFVNNAFDRARISARLSIRSSAEKQALVNTIQTWLDNTVPPTGVDIRITGRAVQEVAIIHSLVSGQVLSLSLALAVISICMFAVFRSFSLGLICFIPNLFPLLVNFGIMGAWNIPLNTATSLISAVALGIVVDDTIHFISKYRDQRKTKTIDGAVKAAILEKGRPIMITTCILSTAFCVLVLSSFVPTIQFGILTTIIMVTALIGDLIVLPAVFLLKK